MNSLLRSCVAATVLLAGSAASTEPPPPGRDFGAGLRLTQTTPLTEVATRPEQYTQLPVLLRGRLTDLCTKKGCWTVLAEGDVSLRVRFLDYGFFLPQDALGATALVEGVAEIRTLSEREARHIAAESRSGDPAKIKGAERQVGFVATGVRLLDRPPQQDAD